MNINFDGNATTPLIASALDAMVEAYRQGLGNPSAPHALGEAARECLETNRRRILETLGADPAEWRLIFTSGATEANYLALNAPLAADGNFDGLLVSAVEHSSVLNMRHFAQIAPVTVVPVLASGAFDLAALRQHATGGRYLLSLMHANNETGILMSVVEAARTLKRDQGLLHVDAAQTAGRLDITDVLKSADLVTFSAHKFGGPVGIGGLLARRSVKMRAVLPGGLQEQNLRSGTVNVPAIVATAVALEENLRSNFQKLSLLRDALEVYLRENFAAQIIGANSEVTRLPNTSCVAFAGLLTDDLIHELSARGICVGKGAACTGIRDSHVLEAMNVDPILRKGMIRISLSHLNKPSDVNQFIAEFPDAYKAAAVLSPYRLNLTPSEDRAL